MDDPLIFGLLIFLLLLFLTLRSAFRSINQMQLELDKNKLNYHSKILNFISKRTIDFSITINICYFITLVLTILVLSSSFYSYFNAFNSSLLLFIFAITVGVLIYPGLKIFPKTFGDYFSNEIINFSAIILLIIYIIVFPITKLVLLLSNAPIRILYNESIQSENNLDFKKEDLNKLVEESQKHLPDDEVINSEIKLFKNALEFPETKIRECMIPRNEISAIEINDINKELKQKFISTGFSKILIYKETIDDIIGFIKSKTLFKSKSHFKKNIRGIKYFPETMPANKLLRHFIRTGQSIAVVVDEFGGTSGVITIEDILEEIFGEIQDEHDTEELYEKELSENDFIFSGRLEIDYLNEKYNLNIPENEEYETIAGFILNFTESLPKINDNIKIETFNFTILKVSDTRVELVKLEILSKQI